MDARKNPEGEKLEHAPGLSILYVGMKYDYGFPERGYSFEHWNFYDSLVRMGHEVQYFDFMTMNKDLGRNKMNRRLEEIVQVEKPEILFSILFKNELDMEVIDRISSSTDTVTINWFSDDHWRFESFSRHWAPRFNWVVTTSERALPKYEEIGYRNVIKSQWGFNKALHRRLDMPMKYDVTFVGQPHGDRRSVVDALRRNGINVEVWGTGWETGRIEQENMIQVFNQSRINLNLSNASTAGPSRRVPKGVMRTRALAGKALELSGFGRRAKAWRRSRLASRAEQINLPDQIKARNFEIPGCGGFLLTGNAENLEDYFKIGEEVVCFDSLVDMLDKIRYYVAHEGEREEIAWAGYERSQREHTYEHRFQEILQIVGFP